MPCQPKKGSKRVYVSIDEKQHVDLKVRLNYLGISMSEFVRACGEGLLNQHPIMEQFMDHYRETSPKFSKKKAKDAKKDREQAEKLESDLDLNFDEIEDIFDIIEDDHPEI